MFRIEDINLNIERADSDLTLLFVHGFGTTQSCWQSQRDYFKGRYTVVSYDHLGSGHLSRSISKISFSSFKWLLMEVLDKINLPNVVFIGHSVSGVLGLMASLERAKVFQKMVIIGASPCYLNSPGYHGGLDNMDLESTMRIMALSYLDWVTHFSKSVAGNFENVSEYLANTLSSLKPDLAQCLLREIFYLDVRSKLSEITIPTLLISLTQDQLVPSEVAVYMHEQMSTSRLEMLAGQGHFPQMTYPDQVNYLIQQFLEE